MQHACTPNCDNGISSTTLQRLRLMLLGLAATLIGACGGGEVVSTPASSVGSASSACSDCGTALLTMTDAAGDFLGYTVDVTSLQLKKADGTVVQTLPATSRIDFAQLVDLSEVLSMGQIPAGQYVAATLRVDFTHADIMVDDGTGKGVAVSPVDSAGHALGLVELSVQLDSRNHLEINRARISHLAFDLDLQASNSVNLAAHTVTVSPIVVASVLPPESREVRARGRLASVDLAGSSYTIDLRPFREATDSKGQLVVHTTSTTRFEINGSVSTGPAGLTQLAALTDHPLAIAFGTITSADHAFTAVRVLAATSAEDERRDYLTGNVLSRSGNTLMVAGLRAGRGEASASVEREPVAVTIGPNTGVTRDGQGSGALGIRDISVGQHVEVYGDLTRDPDGHARVDATAGRVRLNYTHLVGRVAATTGSGLALQLQSIDGRSAASFTFTGTGATPASDADPANYEVGTGALGTAGMGINAYTRVSGFVTPFGTAPPDFTADTFLDFTDTRAELVLNWGPNGVIAPFSASSALALAVNLSTGAHGGVKLGDRLIDVATLSTGLRLVPAATGNLTFAIGHRGSHDVGNFSSFADFATQLVTQLNGTTSLFSIAAEGAFDATSGVFTATRLLVVLSN